MKTHGQSRIRLYRCWEAMKRRCQRCHLHYDRHHHAQARYRTQREGNAMDMFKGAAHG